MYHLISLEHHAPTRILRPNTGTSHRLRDEDASKETMNAILAFEKKILYPVRRIMKMMDPEPVFETCVTVVFTKTDSEDVSCKNTPVISLLQLHLCDPLAEDHALRRSVSLFREYSDEKQNNRKSRRRRALRTDKEASIVLSMNIDSKPRVMYVKVRPDLLTMKSLSMNLKSEAWCLDLQFHRLQDFQLFRDRLRDLFLGKNTKSVVLEEEEEEEKKEEEEEDETKQEEEEKEQDEEEMSRIIIVERQIRHLVKVKCFEAAALLCGQNSHFKSWMILCMFRSKTHRDVVTHWCDKLDVSISRMEKRFEETNLQISRTTMEGLDEILFVDSLSGVHEARRILLPDIISEEFFVLGMDCEWKPIESGRKTSSVCLVRGVRARSARISIMFLTSINTSLSEVLEQQLTLSLIAYSFATKPLEHNY